MQYRHYLRVLVAALILAALHPACKKTDLSNAEFEEHTSEFAFPLFTTSISLQDLLLHVLNDSLSGDTIRINPDNTMTLFYSGDVAQKKATDIFEFFKLGVVPVRDTLYYAPYEAPDSLSVRKVTFKGGNFAINIINFTGQPITGTFYIPQMTNEQGETFKYDFSVPAAFLPPFNSPPIDVTGWTLTSDNNTLFFRYEAYTPNGTRIRFPDPPFFDTLAGLNLFFDQLEFSYLEGYWGTTAYPLTRDTIEIDINQTDLKGDVKITDPKVTMTISNSWGFPTRGVVKYLSFIGPDGTELPLESTALDDDSIDFAYPSWAAGEIGESKQTYVYFDKDNSNIDDIFNLQPTRMIYEVEGVSNAAMDPDIIGFMTDSSNIALSMQVELLLEGSAKNFGAEQTLDLNFGEYSGVDSAKIEAVEFKLVTENSTPIATNLQLYFRDEAGNNIDSLFTNGLTYVMEAAPVDANGNVTGIKRTENYIPMDVDRFDRIRRAKTAYLRTYFTTAEGGQQSVLLLATQEAVVKMGIKVKTRL